MSAVAEKLAAEAAAAGLELIGQGCDRHYRRYRWVACGHEQEYRASHVRIGNVRCQTCLDDNLKAEAAAVRLELLGPGRNCHHRTYRWITCGHVAEYHTGSVRKGRVRCQTCLDDNLKAEAAAAGLELLGSGRDRNHRRYRRLTCGHEAEYRTDHVRKGGVRCQTCLDEKLKSEAAAAGLELLGSGRDRNYRRYRWVACGHVTEYHTGSVRRGYGVCCQVCDATAYSKPSNLYLLHFAADDGHEWLKLGVAKHIDGRISGYGLFAGVRLIERLAVTPMPTGEIATTAEKSLHKHFRRHRLPPKRMSAYMQSGQTECYPVALQQELIEYVEMWG